VPFPLPDCGRKGKRGTGFFVEGDRQVGSNVGTIADGCAELEYDFPKHDAGAEAHRRRFCPAAIRNKFAARLGGRRKRCDIARFHAGCWSTTRIHSDGPAGWARCGATRDEGQAPPRDTRTLATCSCGKSGAEALRHHFFRVYGDF